MRKGVARVATRERTCNRHRVAVHGYQEGNTFVVCIENAGTKKHLKETLKWAAGSVLHMHPTRSGRQHGLSTVDRNHEERKKGAVRRVRAPRPAFSRVQLSWMSGLSRRGTLLHYRRRPETQLVCSITRKNSCPQKAVRRLQSPGALVPSILENRKLCVCAQRTRMIQRKGNTVLYFSSTQVYQTCGGAVATSAHIFSVRIPLPVPQEAQVDSQTAHASPWKLVGGEKVRKRNP